MEKEVKHKKWSNEITLFEDGWSSAIWGNYENEPKKKLGVRWKEQGSEPGFPSLFGNPIWFVERDFLEKPILLELYFQALKLPASETKEKYLTNLKLALSEV